LSQKLIQYAGVIEYTHMGKWVDQKIDDIKPV
jgi:hypothetical protein